MKIQKAASIPLVVHDPFFSIWSASDCLYEADPVHWSGARQRMRGFLELDGKHFCFLGDREFHDYLPQVSVNVTATATEYTFENDMVFFTCRFTSPLLPQNMLLVSRPCTYVDFVLQKKKPVEANVWFEVSADLVRSGKDRVVGFSGRWEKEDTAYSYASMGRAVQQPLSGSGNCVTIDWGYAYLATQSEDACVSFDSGNEVLRLKVPFAGKKESSMILAYDDLLSINYYGQWQRAYWTNFYDTILDAIGAAFDDRGEIMKQAALLDGDMEEKACAIGGEAYAFVCNMSFRQAFAAHKLVTDENGNVLFLSKENGSNGCIGTVDVSYPSVPLFLRFDTEYVKGMLRPIFRFADYGVWQYDFAPHDVGRYPYAWGQVYGLKPELRGTLFQQEDGAVYPPLYQYPAGSEVYEDSLQMPVEECGNMLILTAAVCLQDGNAEFARPYWNQLSKWKEYLLKYGADPGEQLCTDDFAGHLSHNVNLSAKAILGVEAYAKLACLIGNTEDAEIYHSIAKTMAKNWENQADVGDHYALSFGQADSWSLKYNLVWDRIWKSGLFSDRVYDKEIAFYLKKQNMYGIPLDSRAAYTKSDWLLWCAAMAEKKETVEAMIEPIAKFLISTPGRVPFSDWYDTETGKYFFFKARSVQGGLFMPIYAHSAYLSE